MEAFLSAVAVVALPGLTVLAYKHPQSYPAFATTLTVVSCFGILILAVWGMAVYETTILLVTHMADDSPNPSEIVAGLHVLNRDIWIGFTPFIIYVQLLRFLPYWSGEKHLGNEGDRPPDRKRRDEDLQEVGQR